MSYIPAYMGNVSLPMGFKPKPKKAPGINGGSMEIEVKKLDGKQVQLRVDPDTTIE